MKKILLFILFILLSANFVFASNKTIENNISFSINEGKYNITWPGSYYADNTTPLSAVWSFNNTCENPDYNNATMNLASGTSNTFNACYNYLNVSCAACNQNCTINNIIDNRTGFCDYQNTLVPGQKLNLQKNNCSLNITVTDWVAGINDSYNVTRNLFIGKNNETFYLSLENWSQTIAGGWENATVKVPVTYTCPIIPSEQISEADNQNAFEVCSYFFPSLNSWMNMTLNRCFDNYDAYRDYVNTHDVIVTKQNQELSDCRASAGQKDGEITVLRAQLQTTNDQIKNTSDNQVYLWMAIIALVIMLIICGLVIGYGIHRMGADSEGSSGE